MHELQQNLISEDQPLISGYQPCQILKKKKKKKKKNSKRHLKKHLEEFGKMILKINLGKIMEKPKDKFKIKY